MYNNSGQTVLRHDTKATRNVLITGQLTKPNENTVITRLV